MLRCYPKLSNGGIQNDIEAGASTVILNRNNVFEYVPAVLANYILMLKAELLLGMGSPLQS